MVEGSLGPSALGTPLTEGRDQSQSAASIGAVGGRWWGQAKNGKIQRQVAACIYILRLLLFGAASIWC